MLNQRTFRPTAILMLWSVAGGVAHAGEGKRSPESDLAAPGAALYQSAVTESVRSLMADKEHTAPGAQGRPPSPGPDYFWCESCKSYHLKQPAAQGAGRVQPTPAAATPVANPNAAAGAGARPPSPGPDAFWCDQCKTYHLRQPTPAQNVPGLASGPDGPHPAAAGQATPQTPGGAYYYCEQCRTYHLRQPPAQRPATNLNSFLGAGSNRVSQESFMVPERTPH